MKRRSRRRRFRVVIEDATLIPGVYGGNMTFIVDKDLRQCPLVLLEEDHWYHYVYGSMLCILLFNFVNYVFLLLWYVIFC
jgi:hypothetical protein